MSQFILATLGTVFLLAYFTAANLGLVHRVVSSPEALQWEAEGKIDGIGVQIFENTPKPTASPMQTLKGESIPDVWDWRLNARLHSNSLTQRGPLSWCGACHAFAAVSSLTDRFAIQFPKQFPNIILSVQELLNCARTMGFGDVGCNGSQTERSMAYIEKYGVVDSTCAGYLGVERAYSPYAFGNDQCWKYQCRECISSGKCDHVPNHKKWGISSWGQLKGEAAIKQAIYTGGPVACYMNTHRPAYAEYKGGIISDPTIFPDPANITHVVSLIGYGVEQRGTQQVPYWISRNWVNSAWGEDGGYFRIFRGNNTLNIESNCIYANPDIDWKPPQ